LASIVLVHSPLVGPTTWSWVGDELRQRGYDVLVPSLVPVAGSGRWQDVVDAVVRDATGAVEEHWVLVGHSGAGPLLPVIARRMAPSPARLVFVDAGVPPAGGEATLIPGEMLDSLRRLARDGMLPRWSEWFGPEAMEALMPDRHRRHAVLAELPEVPLSYFEARVPMPGEWSSADGAYVLLSDPYRPDAVEAASRGWPVTELRGGGHLDIVTRPADVAVAILHVLRSTTR
jgi:pimeloyl-ACP methyl ester carboxylesterase